MKLQRVFGIIAILILVLPILNCTAVTAELQDDDKPVPNVSLAELDAILLAFRSELVQYKKELLELNEVQMKSSYVQNKVSVAVNQIFHYLETMEAEVGNCVVNYNRVVETYIAKYQTRFDDEAISRLNDFIDAAENMASRLREQAIAAIEAALDALRSLLEEIADQKKDTAKRNKDLIGLRDQVEAVLGTAIKFNQNVRQVDDEFRAELKWILRDDDDDDDGDNDKPS